MRRLTDCFTRSAFILVGVVIAGCEKQTPPTQPPAVQAPEVTPSQTTTVHPPTAVADVPKQGTVVPPTTGSPPAASAGARNEQSAEEFQFVAAINSAGPTDPTLAIDVHGKNGFHINDLYPVVLSLDATGAGPAVTFRKTDAANFTQEKLVFSLPIKVKGAGDPVHGQLRFGVCTESQCKVQTTSFTVSL